MNPAEGAAEEGAVPDSEVDAFFRTGRGAAGKGPGQRRALPPPRDAGLAAAARAPPVAEPRGREKRGWRGSPPASSLCPPQPLGAPVAPPVPGRMLPQGCAPTASGEDRPGPRPKQAQKPRGDARGELSRCHPRGKQRRLGAGWAPPGPRPGRRRPPGYRLVFGSGAGCLPRSSRAKRRALPLPPSGGQRRPGQRSPAAGRGC